MTRSFLYFIGLVFVLCSCTYEPEGEFFEDIQPYESNPNFTISMGDIKNNDTIYIRTGYRRFKMNLSKHNYVANFNYMLNGEQIFPSHRSIRELELSISDFNDGINTFEFNATVNSGKRSGSLADQLKKEGQSYTKKFFIYKITENTTPKLSLKSHAVEDGRLKINFTPYPHPDLSHYSIMATHKGKHSSIVYQMQWDFYDNSFIDSSFIETPSYSHYYIQTYAPSGFVHPLSIVFEHYPLSPLNFQPQNSTNLKVSWNKTKFHNNFDKYQLRVYGFDNYTVDNPILYEVDNTEDTTLILTELPFTTDLKVDYRILPKKSNNYEYWLNNSVGTGHTIPWQVINSSGYFCSIDYSKVFYLNNYRRQNTIYVYSPSSNTIEKEIEFEGYRSALFQSPNSTVCGAFNSHSIFLVDKKNYKIEEVIKFDNDYSNYIHYLAADDIGNIYIADGNYYPTLYKYNRTTKEKTLLAKCNFKFNAFKVNATGTHVIIQNKLYQIINNELIKEKAFWWSHTTHFIPNTNYCCGITKTESAIVYDYVKKSIISEIQLDADFYELSTDKKIIIAAKNNKTSLIDLFTGKILTSLKNDKTERHNYYTHNGKYFYNGNRYKIKLNIN